MPASSLTAENRGIHVCPAWNGSEPAVGCGALHWKGLVHTPRAAQRSDCCPPLAAPTRPCAPPPPSRRAGEARAATHRNSASSAHE
eukprot:365658-Chlamydomonas_euryale.AAC.7